MSSAIGDLLEREESQRAKERVDFRMVTFSLGGREYAFDIMDVKEISKITTFTFVPNTASYVRGVYNLRGDIVSIIDLRLMFHLSTPKRAPGEPEDVLFLRAGERVIGVIVDEVENVIGVSRERLKPPPSLFGSINVGFIRGVVEHERRLYVLLESDMVLGEEIQRTPDQRLEPIVERSVVASAEADGSALDRSFVAESLEAQCSFHLCDLNERWFDARFAEWEKERIEAGATVQTKSPDDARSFLAPFASAYTGDFWADDYRIGVQDLLPDIASRSISAWVIGVGEGYEAYSLACIMRERYPEASISIWAHDSDLLKISIAPILVVDRDRSSEDVAKYLALGSNGYLFNEEIRAMIYFEYHDVLHDNTFPEVDIVVVRDLLSFLRAEERDVLLSAIRAKLSDSGIVFVGDHEHLCERNWESAVSRGVRCYRKK